MSEPKTATSSDSLIRVRATSRSLPIALLRARETVMGPIRAMLAEAGVTEQQWRVLRVLAEGGVMDPKDIAREACLLMPSLTRIMQGLDEKGFLLRRAHQTDGRKLLVEITTAGCALIERHIPESNKIFAGLEDKYGKQQLEQLLDLLNDLTDVEL